MEKKNNSCVVLVCTYNGDKYLREQLDSILNQKGVDVHIKVADDCSTDSTLDILNEYKEKYSNFDFYENDINKNFTYNFIDLLNSCDDKYDYYAFSDQDDVWDKEKLIVAINMLKKQEDCINGHLYISNQNVVDEHMHFIKKTYESSPEFDIRYKYLCENICTGCTMVFDRDFKILACKYRPKNIVLHDHYYFLLSVFCAKFVYDHNAYINYRQHGNNLIGVNEKKTSLRKRIARTIKRKYHISDLSREILEGYSNLISADDKKYITICSKYKKNVFSKLKLLFTKKIIPHNHIINFKIKILINKF